MTREQDELLRCSFCGKLQSEVRKLVAGASAYICDECVDICIEITRDDNQNIADEAAHKETNTMSTKYESAELILKLYELRREPKMREAREWFAYFSPESAQDFMSAAMGEHSAHLRMVTSYWDMAASLVNHGGIDVDMFNDANMEHVFVFSKMEPFIAEMRQMISAPNAWKNLEQLVMQMPNAKELLAGMRERSKRMAQMRADEAARATHTEAANA